MDIKICKACGEKPVHVKKRQLCVSCYAKLRNNTNMEPVKDDVVIIHRSEMVFIQNYFEHSSWIYQPATFFLENALYGKYTPDFYDVKENVFIEVIGTRQAFHANNYKYEKFKVIFPRIKLEFRSVLGNLIDVGVDRIVWPQEVNGNKSEV